ncbi:Glyoxalase/bleomycin resistance protein/dioxygenase [Thiomonas delicata]|uniref:Glyoxalase/bleomycin resistance protein/dioxygenase n=1 Tax=Thiomonas delicata TaxID=364030 RepID=A0A238D974_THIDL|nr:Glyoxalase/bleomycin resistance protein/dioxygenase [Thiomonas delicata]
MLLRKLERLPMPESLQDEGLEMWTFPMQMDRMGAAGALVKMPGAPSGGMGTMVYFSCDDCAVEAARIAPAGGRIERPKTAIGEYGHIVIAVDTEGNTFGLHSMQ